MAYPTALDTLINPTPANTLATVPHDQQHSLANNAIMALEAKLGISASTPASGSVMRATGTGSSAWGQVQTGDIANTAITTALIASANITPPLMATFDRIRLEQQSDQNLANNTVVPIAFGTSSEKYKSQAGLHSTVTNNTRINILTTGLYIVTGSVRFAGGNTTNRYEVTIRANGSSNDASSSIPATATSAYVNIATQVVFTAGDYIELCAFQATGGTITAQAETDTFFTASYLP